MHVVQAKTLIVQEQKQLQEYNTPNNQFGNQQYNSRPNGQNQRGNGQKNKNNQYNHHGYNQNNRFRQNAMKCFLCWKGHVKVDCHVWRKVMEEEEKNSKPKVGIKVAMVKWDQSVVDVCVTT